MHPGDWALILTILSAALGALALELHITRREIMARKSSEFRKEATKFPYELELEDGSTVTFQDPNRLSTKSAFELSEANPKDALKLLLGKDFAKFWEEFSERPAEETNAVLEDVMEWYGAEMGKREN